MSNPTLGDQDPPENFLYALTAPESRRQYPRRLKVFLDYLADKRELTSNLLEKPCEEFIKKSKQNHQWANKHLMEFVLLQTE